MHVHTSIFLQIHWHVTVLVHELGYVHGMYMVYTKGAINVYVHGSNMYVHVYRFMSVFELYIHHDVHTMYKRVHAVFCSSSSWYDSDVECVIHFMKCTDIAQPSMYIAEPGTYITEPGTYFAEPGSCRIQLFDSPGLLACHLESPPPDQNTVYRGIYLDIPGCTILGVLVRCYGTGLT